MPSRPVPVPNEVQLATNAARALLAEARESHAPIALINAVRKVADAVDRLAADLAAGKR